MPGVSAERFVSCAERGFELRQLARRTLELSADAPRYRAALASFLFRALPTRRRIAQPLFGNRNLSAQLLGTLALIRDESAELRASRFSGRAGGESRVAR